MFLLVLDFMNIFQNCQDKVLTVCNSITICPCPRHELHGINNIADIVSEIREHHEFNLGEIFTLPLLPDAVTLVKLQGDIFLSRCT
jgi:hypothetical protein